MRSQLQPTHFLTYLSVLFFPLIFPIRACVHIICYIDLFNAYYIRGSRPFWPDLNVFDTAKRPDLFLCLFARKPITKIFIIVTLLRSHSSRLMDLA